MKKTPALLSVLGLTLAAPCYAGPWKDLFDGTTLKGWDSQSEANWHVDGGSIIADKGREGLLTTTESFTGNYEIEVVFRAEKDTRSGVYLSTPKVVTSPGSECYELSIAPSSDSYPTGSLEGRERASSEDSGGWHTYRAKIDGPNVSIWLDGKLMVEYKDRKPLKGGRIGLQFDRGRIEFQKVRIKDAGLP